MTRTSLRFQSYILDLRRLSLYGPAGQINLRPKSFEVLRYLVEHAGRVVGKDDVIKAVWSDVTVTDESLTRCISEVRRAIGDDAQQIIKTVPRRGYLFTAPVASDATAVRPSDASADRDAGRATADKHAPAPYEPPLPNKPSIAVLSFTNMSGDPDQDVFGEGLAEDIITQLSKLRWLFVIARNSSFTFKGQAVDVKRVSQELGVRYVVEGSVRKAGNRVRVTAQLIDAPTAIHVWAERYDRELADIFALQDEITNTIVATLEPQISAAERERARRKPPEGIDCWEAYQRGMWHLLRRRRDDLFTAQEHFRNACALDPSFAPARAGIAIAIFYQIVQGYVPNRDQAVQQLFSEGVMAVSLDPNEPLAHSALGLAYMERGEFDRSISEHRTALDMNPNSAFGRWAMGYAFNHFGHHEDALDHFEMALRLSPKDPSAWSYLTLKASALYQLRRYDEAARCAAKAAENPINESVWPYVHLAASLGQLGRIAEARPVLDELALRGPASTLAAIRNWPHIVRPYKAAVEHMMEGLAKAGLPE